jgi:hypothetical protein
MNWPRLPRRLDAYQRDRLRMTGVWLMAGSAVYLAAGVVVVVITPATGWSPAMRGIRDVVVVSLIPGLGALVLGGLLMAMSGGLFTSPKGKRPLRRTLSRRDR